MLKGAVCSPNPVVLIRLGMAASPEAFFADQQFAHPPGGRRTFTLPASPVPVLSKGLTQNAISGGLCLWELKTRLNRSVSFLKTCKHFKRGFPLRWMKLVPVTENGVSQEEKNKYCIY